MPWSVCALRVIFWEKLVVIGFWPFTLYSISVRIPFKWKVLVWWYYYVWGINTAAACSWTWQFKFAIKHYNNILAEAALQNVVVIGVLVRAVVMCGSCAAFIPVWVLVKVFLTCLGGGSCCCGIQHPVAGIAIHGGGAWLVLLFDASKALLKGSITVQVGLLP